MSSSLSKVTLGEITVDGKGSYGIPASAVDKNPKLYTYLRITDITDEGDLIREGLKSVDDSKAANYVLKKNDIVFARTGNSTGRSYFHKTDEELVYAGFLIKFSLNPEKVNPKFIRYYTLTDEYKGWVKSFSTGSTRGNINAKTLADMEINLPSRAKQDFAVGILDFIEQKTELNRDTIKTLEEIIKVIFTEWFINFDFPNKQCLPYRLSGGEMLESELGQIPKGWKVGKLQEVIDFFNGYAFKSKQLLNEPNDDCYHVFKMGHIKKGGGLNKSGTKSYFPKEKAKGLQKYILKKGDLLMSMTDMKSNVALLGHTALMDIDNEYIVNQRVGLLRGKDNHPMKYPYLYLLTNNENFINDLRSRANSGVQVNLSTAEIKASKLILPEHNILKMFNDIAEPMFEQIFSLQAQNLSLEKLREIILPKLILGEIEKPDESVVETS